jgi:hypothetical protein
MTSSKPSPQNRTHSEITETHAGETLLCMPTVYYVWGSRRFVLDLPQINAPQTRQILHQDVRQRLYKCGIAADPPRQVRGSLPLNLEVACRFVLHPLQANYRATQLDIAPKILGALLYPLEASIEKPY